MILTQRSLGFLALSFFLGILVGTVLGEAIGLFLDPDGMAHQLFVSPKEFGFGPTPIDLIIVEFTVGLYFSVNLMSVIGIFVVAQLLRWFR